MVVRHAPYHCRRISIFLKAGPPTHTCFRIVAPRCCACTGSPSSRGGTYTRIPRSRRALYSASPSVLAPSTSKHSILIGPIVYAHAVLDVKEYHTQWVHPPAHWHCYRSRQNPPPLPAQGVRNDRRGCSRASQAPSSPLGIDPWAPRSPCTSGRQLFVHRTPEFSPTYCLSAATLS